MKRPRDHILKIATNSMWIHFQKTVLYFLYFLYPFVQNVQNVQNSREKIFLM